MRTLTVAFVKAPLRRRKALLCAADSGTDGIEFFVVAAAGEHLPLGVGAQRRGDNRLCGGRQRGEVNVAVPLTILELNAW